MTEGEKKCWLQANPEECWLLLLLVLLMSTAPLPLDAERGFFSQGNEQDHSLGVDGVMLGR